MGCCGLESGDAFAAIPVRKLISWHSPAPPQTISQECVPWPKPSDPAAGVICPPIHPDAAAIDIGATMHVAAVSPDRDPEPVRTFGTVTDELHRLADWFEKCGIKTIAMESTGVYWIPAYEIL